MRIPWLSIVKAGVRQRVDEITLKTRFFVIFSERVRLPLGHADHRLDDGHLLHHGPALVRGRYGPLPGSRRLAQDGDGGQRTRRKADLLGRQVAAPPS